MIELESRVFPKFTITQLNDWMIELESRVFPVLILTLYEE